MRLTIDGKQLPPPDPKFGGVIKGSAAQSQAWWAPRVVQPQGAPNILLIITDDAGFIVPGTGTLKVDGKVVDSKKMEKTLPMILQWDESFDIGSDTLTGVDDADYQPPFPLTAKLDELTIRIERPELSAADVNKLEAAQRNNRISE